MKVDRPIGVFDSGVGGLSILRALRARLPGEDFVYIADTEHAPYGERGDAFVADRARDVTRRLVQEHRAKLVVVACNTATAAAIHLLRDEFPGTRFVGVEPAVKPAASLTRSGTIGVMATRTTLASAKFALLLDKVAEGVAVRMRACDGLADAIEQGDEAEITRLCREHIGALGPFGAGPGEIDTLVLGCTHYPLAMESIVACVGPSVQVIDPCEAVARQVEGVLKRGTQ